MPPWYIRMKTDKEKIQEILKFHELACSDWELGFLKDIYDDIAMGKKPNDNQREVLDRIYDKATDSPY